MFKNSMVTLLSVVLLGAGVIGCGQSGPKMYIVKGTVTHNGKPVSKLQVTMIPDDLKTKAESMGITDDQGKFDLMVGSVPGVFPGPHTFTAIDPLAAVGGQTSNDPDYVEVCKKYAPGSSPLKFDIQKNESNLEVKLD